MYHHNCTQFSSLIYSLWACSKGDGCGWAPSRCKGVPELHGKTGGVSVGLKRKIQPEPGETGRTGKFMTDYKMLRKSIYKEDSRYFKMATWPIHFTHLAGRAERVWPSRRFVKTCQQHSPAQDPCGMGFWTYPCAATMIYIQTCTINTLHELLYNMQCNAMYIYVYIYTCNNVYKYNNQ